LPSLVNGSHSGLCRIRSWLKVSCKITIMICR
jgi:hypothetical protein